ncbi:MAG: helix-turn-helix transcriptional regulator [Gemmatimonadaceae bacterium]|jgi:AraC-like DNA-binding protein|nr:helix-turn-helix transcriptional regulator [Gemmatimonadaceae bacterium]
MAKIRQSAGEGRVQVRAIAVGFTTGYRWQSPPSAWGQLIFASRGALTVETPTALWVVSPRQAVWLPGGEAHAVRLAGRGVLRRVYVRRSVRRVPRVAGVVPLTALLREVLRRAVAIGALASTTPMHAHLLAVLYDELAVTGARPIELPMPRDPRARRAAELARHDPGRARDAAWVAREAGASVRTLERCFRADTGMSFGAWRQRARLLVALERLANGASVTAAGLEAGYAGTSAFVAAFRRETGVTPGRWGDPSRPRSGRG